MLSHRLVVLVTWVVGFALWVCPLGQAAAQQGQESLGGLRQEIRQLTESVQGARQDLLVVQRTQARTMATVEELQTIVQTVDAKLEEFNHRLRDLSRRIDALQVGISKRRVLQATPPPAPAAEPPGPSEPEAAEGPEPAEVEEAKSARLAEGEKAETLRPPIPSEEVPAEVSPPKQIVPPPAPAGPITREMVDVAVLNPGEVFRAAHEDYVKGNYDLAILGFRDYLKKYPATEQASSAQYWLGESYLSQSDYSKAVEEFQRLLDMYPTSPKVPTALYKQSLAYRELKQHDKARTNLDAVVSQFPTSVEAKHAAEELKTLPASQ